MRFGLRGRLFAAAALTLLLVSSVFGLLVLTVAQTRDVADSSQLHTEAIAAAMNLERLTVDLELGVRGFVSTGDEQALEPWRRSREQIPAAERALVVLVRDDPAQTAAAVALVAAIDDYRDGWAVPVVEAARSDLERARSQVASGEGEQRSAAVRARFARFAAGALAHAGTHIERSNALAARAIAIGGGGLVAFTLLMLVLVAYFTRTTTTPLRRLAVTARRLGAGDLTARVPEQGVAEVGELMHAFNAMATGVEESQEELARLNARVEAQAERLRLLWEAAPEATVITDRSGKITLVNTRAEKLFGYTRDELLDESVSILLPESARDAHAGQLVGYMSTPRARHLRADLDIQGRRKDGSLFPADIALSPVELEQGLLVIASIVDITERKQAEKEIRRLNTGLENQNAELETQTVQLEENQAQLAAANDELLAQQAELERALAELADEKERIEAFYRFGERLVAETEVEPLAQAILGQTGDYIRAEAGALYVLEPERGDVHALVATRGLDRTRLAPTVVAGEGLTGRALAELRTLRDEQGASGLRLPGLDEGIPVLHELHVPLVHAGRPVGALVLGRAGEQGFSADELGGIGHLADQASVALANALTLRQARRLADINKAVLDATVDGISLLDVEGNVALMNEAQRRVLMDVFDLPAEGDLATRVLGFAPRTTDPAGFLAAIEARRTDPEAEVADEFTLLDPPRTFERFSAPVRGGDGSALGRIVVLRDVTARRAADRFKDELVATVSHELRTPLTGILGFSELLVSQDVDAATRTHYLQTIYHEARRLTDLVNDFLDVQRFESGRVELAREMFSLADVLRTAAALFAGQSDAHTLELELTDELLEVRGDRDRTAQVIANLLSNAIKYSPAGGTVTITAARKGKTLRVSITDRGFGIPAEQQHRVFEKFFRVDSTDTRAIGGTGLGLALAKDVVEAQSGTIGFESVHGAGSTFWFELPAA